MIPSNNSYVPKQNDLNVKAKKDKKLSLDSQNIKSGSSPTFEGLNTSKSISSVKQYVKSNNDIYNIFGLNLIPDLPEESLKIKLPGCEEIIEITPEQLREKYKSHNDTKKALISNSSIYCNELLVNQYRNYPVMQESVNALQHSFNELDEFFYNNDTRLFQRKYKEIEIQLQNLSIFSKIVSEIDNNKTKESLKKLQNSEHSYLKSWEREWIEMTNSGSIVISEALLRGHRCYTEEDKKIIKERILAGVEKLHQNENIEKNEKPKLPISRKAISSQAKLHQAMRSGKRWALKQKKLTPNGENTNLVYELDDVGFFKMSKDLKLATGSMETLMWNLAVIFGLENSFVPTGLTAVHTQPWVAPVVSQWVSEENLSDTLGKLEGKGGIQPRQVGWTLNEYLLKTDIKPQISSDEVLRVTAAALLFGMWDLHPGNIFITPKGKIKLFDNARSLPNGNGWLMRKLSKECRPAFRCGLLELEQMYKNISIEERKQLKEMVEHFQQKMKDARFYLNSYAGQALIKNLHPGWLDLENSLKATEERITLMAQALDNPECKTLCDLVINSIPFYRHAFTLTAASVLADEVLENLDWIEYNKNNVLELEELQRTAYIHSAIGIDAAEVIYELIYEYPFQIDPGFLKKLAEDPNLNTTQIMSKIIDHILLSKELPMTYEEKSKIIDNAHNYTQMIRDIAVIDNKDLSKDDSEKIIKNDS